MAEYLDKAPSDGTVLGQSATALVGFWGATPVDQPASADQAAVSTTAPTQTSPFGFMTSAQPIAIITLLNEIRSALVQVGIIKGSV